MILKVGKLEIRAEKGHPVKDWALEKEMSLIRQVNLVLVS